MHHRDKAQSSRNYSQSQHKAVNISAQLFIIIVNNVTKKTKFLYFESLFFTGGNPGINFFEIKIIKIRKFLNLQNM